MKYFLDACALIALANDEDGSDLVEKIIEEHECYVHSINVYELYKDSKKRSGDYVAAEELLSELADAGVATSDDMDFEVMRAAADLKLGRLGKGSISIPDVIAVSASKRAGATFLTSDANELGPLAELGFAVELFRAGPPAAQN